MLPDDRACSPRRRTSRAWALGSCSPIDGFPYRPKVVSAIAARLPLRTHHPRLHGLRDRRGGSGTAHRGRVHLGRALGRGGVLRRLQGPRELALLRDNSCPSWSRWLLTPSPLARSFVPCRTVAWALAWSVPAGVIALKAASGQPFLGTIAAWLLAAAVLGWRVARASRTPACTAAGVPGSSPGPREATPPSPGGPARPPPRPPASGRRPRRSPTPTTPPATIRAAPPRPRPPISVEGRDGRTRRDDRAGPGQGASPLDRRLHRGRRGGARWPASAPSGRCGTSCSSARPARTRRR